MDYPSGLSVAFFLPGVRKLPRQIGRTKDHLRCCRKSDDDSESTCKPAKESYVARGAEAYTGPTLQLDRKARAELADQ